MGFFCFSTQKKRKKEEEKMAEVPTFKLVLVGDGGTGESFSFYDDDEKKSDMIFSFYASLSLSFFLSQSAFEKPRGNFFLKEGDDRSAAKFCAVDRSPFRSSSSFRVDDRRLRRFFDEQRLTRVSLFLFRCFSTMLFFDKIII